MMKSYKIMFFFTMIMGTLIAISAYSWLSMWMGLEINLLSIIPLLKSKNNLYPTEAAIKYFITQALASSILLFAILLNLNLGDNFMNSTPLCSLIFNSALFMKLGAAPFHAWFPEVMEGLNWLNCLIMLTWQKIGPMIIILYSLHLTYFFSLIIIFSTAIGSIIGLNQISLRKILAYSSINHIGWMIAGMFNNQSTWWIYFLIYSVISLNIILILYHFSVFYIPQVFSMLTRMKLLKLFFMLNFLSLGGLPPFLGFLPKWLVINNLAQNNYYSISVLIIVFTLITLYFYLRITFSSFTLNFNETPIYSASPLSFWIILFNFISLSSLLTCTLIFNLI